MKLFTIILVIIVALTPVCCIKCIQCNSFQNPDCLFGNASATECPTNKNYSFCTITTGYLKLERLIILFRDCSPKHLGNTCQRLKNDDHNKSSETFILCYSTCQGDGCNNDALRFIRSSSTALDSHSILICLPYLYFFPVIILILFQEKKTFKV